MSAGDVIYLAAVAGFVCFVFALEPLWNVIWRWHHRHDRIVHHFGKRRLGR